MSTGDSSEITYRFESRGRQFSILHRLPSFGSRDLISEADKFLVLRIGAVGIFIGIYHMFDWRFFGIVVRSITSHLLASLGHVTIKMGLDGGLYLFVDNSNIFAFTKDCTYMELMLVLIPICWRFRQTLRNNMQKLALITLAIFSLNIVRLVLAAHLYQEGVLWRFAHDLPDLAINIVVIGAAVLLALRSDRDNSGDNILIPAGLRPR